MQANPVAARMTALAARVRQTRSFMHHRASSRLQSVAALAALALSPMAFALLYLFAVRTRAGQRLDASAVRLRFVLPKSQFLLAVRMHDWVSVASIAFLGGAIVLIAFVRQRPRQALASGVIMVGSMLTSETIKHTWPRPARGITDSLGTHNTFPSGHTTVAMALAVGALVVASPASRRRVAPLSALFATAVGSSLVATASHRPSDIMGAVIVVVGWVAAVRLVMGPMIVAHSSLKEPDNEADVHSGGWMTIGGFVLLLLGFGAAALLILAVHFGRLPAIPIGRSFVAAASAIGGAVLIAVATTVRLLR